MIKMKMKAVAASLALSAALVTANVVPAFAVTAGIPGVSKTLQVNPGSSVTATFKYTATPVALTLSDGTTTYEDGPAVAIEDIVLSADGAEVTGTGAITFGGQTDASAFTHAGIYAWAIAEDPGTYTAAPGEEMQYDPQVYTLVVVVANADAGGLELSQIQVVKGISATVSADGVVDGGDKADPAFVNRFTEHTTTATDLVISKTVTGAQGDKTKLFDFTVTFTAPAVLPAGQTAADALNGITATPTGATDVVFAAAAAGATTRTITFKAADAQSVMFSNVLVGTTYTVEETAVAGYTQSYAAVSNGANVTDTSDVLVGEKTNTGTMTNAYNDITITGVLLNSAPFILLGAIAVAGMVAYGMIKRKMAR